MTSEESEKEARAGATAAVPDTAGAAETGAAETGAADEVPAAAGGTGTNATAVTDGITHPATMPKELAAAHDAAPPRKEEVGARVNASLETIKTAIVWLVVIQLLTILSPLLPVSLKWALIVGLLLMVSSAVVGGVAYLKAQRAQRSLPE